VYVKNVLSFSYNSCHISNCFWSEACLQGC